MLVHNACAKFYKATRVDDGLQIGSQITRKQAINMVRNGKDVYTSTRSAAKSLIKDAFADGRVYWEIHDELVNAVKHFHNRAHHIAHVFFG